MAVKCLLASIVLCIACSQVTVVAQDLLPGFTKSDLFDEQHRWESINDGVRVFMMAPEECRERPRELIVYATPNGSTIEQTLGCKVDGKNVSVDWKHDIQHIAAQVRCYRHANSDRDVVLAVVQAPKLSWPAFRREFNTANARIKELVDRLRDDVKADRVVLSCHSGGGAFLWAWMNAHDVLPTWLHRVVFLDANYSYSDEDRHGDKMIAWLRGNASRRLFVLAYDDREITLNGRKVVEPDGGTFRATERMASRFMKEGPPAESSDGNFSTRRFLKDQATLIVHRNPETKILHTALVGEMNGLIHALTIEQPNADWGKFGGPRAYNDWVSPKPLEDPAKSTASIDSELAPIRLNIPARPGDARSGSELASHMASMSLMEREELVLREVSSGNVPEVSRVLVPIRIRILANQVATERMVTFFATSDYLAIGSDDDFIRMPVSGQTAARLAGKLNCVLPTTRLVDHIDAATDARLEPRPMTKDRESVATFLEHNRLIEQQLKDWIGSHSNLKPRLIGGVKKDIVVTTKLVEKPNNVAIYGWMYPSGTPIQPLYTGHTDKYVDYSHGLRLLGASVSIDGTSVPIRDVLRDETIHGVLSNEGPVDYDELIALTYVKPSK